MAANRYLGATSVTANLSTITAGAKLSLSPAAASSLTTTASSTAAVPEVDACGLPLPPAPQVVIGDYFSVPEPELKKAIAANAPIVFTAAITPSAEAYVNGRFSEISASMTKRQLLVMSKGSRSHLNPANGVVTSATGSPLGAYAVAPPPSTAPKPGTSTAPKPGPASTVLLPPGTITPSTVITPETKLPTTPSPKPPPPINDPNFLKPSVNTFLKYNPDFVLKYQGLNAPVVPTAAELANQGGLALLIKRGGYLLYKPVIDGVMPIASTEPPQETDNYVWGVFVSIVSPGQMQATAAAVAKLVPSLSKVIVSNAPNLGTKAVYVVKMRRLTRSMSRVLTDWAGDAYGYLKSSVKWVCGKITNDKLQTASNYGAAYAAATGPGVVYVAGAVAAWKGAAGACGMAFPKPNGGAPAGCIPTTPPPTVYPTGSVGTFDKKSGVWRIAVPPGSLMGVLMGAALYIEHGAEAILPDGVAPVSIWEFQKLTRQWWRRWSTYIMVGIGAAAVGAGAGTMYYGEREHKALPR